MQNFKYNYFEIEFFSLNSINSHRQLYSIKLTDYLYRSACIIYGKLEYFKNQDYSTYNYGKLLNYFFNTAAQYSFTKPENYYTICQDWFNFKPDLYDLRSLEFQILINRLIEYGHLIDRIYYLSNEVDESIIDWHSSNFHSEEEPEWLIRITKINNRVFNLEHDPSKLNIEWKTINPFHFEYNLNTPSNAVDFFIWENMKYSDCVKLVIKNAQQLHNLELNKLAV